MKIFRGILAVKTMVTLAHIVVLKIGGYFLVYNITAPSI